MTDKTDALVALADGWEAFANGHGIAVNAAYNACAQQLREALATQPAGAVGAIAGGLVDAYMEAATTPDEQPAEGDGAVAGNIPSRLFVHPHPLEPDEKVAEQRKFAAGWNACVSAYEGAAALTRPSAAAAVPERIVLWSRNVAPHWYFVAEKSQRADIEGRPVYETLDPIVLKGSPEAAPATPKGGVVDEAIVRRARTAMAAHPDALHRDMPTVSMLRAALTAALAQQEPRHD